MKMKETNPQYHGEERDDIPAANAERLFTLDALKISLIYLIFGILWIIFSDNILLSLPRRPQDVILVSSIKGVLFIIVTTALLFMLIRHFSRQLKERDRRLKMIASNIPGVIYRFRVNPDGSYGFDYISGRSREILGLENTPSRFFDAITRGIVPDDRERFLTSVREAVSTKTRWKFESQFTKPSGETIWLSAVSNPVMQNGTLLFDGIVFDVTERMRSQKALEQATKKLNLLNYVTFRDIQNMIFTVSGYQALAKTSVQGSPAADLIGKEDEILQKISHSLKFVQSYQDLGIRPPQWQNVGQVFLLSISHLDFLRINHDLHVDGLELFADPLLEQVFQILADNTLVHGKTATKVTLTFSREAETLTLCYDDDGAGIPEETKIRMFSPDFQRQKGVGLFLAKEILEITGITIRETGTPGKGARFEMVVPAGAFRFSGGTPHQG